MRPPVVWGGVKICESDWLLRLKRLFDYLHKEQTKVIMSLSLTRRSEGVSN